MIVSMFKVLPLFIPYAHAGKTFMTKMKMVARLFPKNLHYLFCVEVQLLIPIIFVQAVVGLGLMIHLFTTLIKIQIW